METSVETTIPFYSLFFCFFFFFFSFHEEKSTIYYLFFWPPMISNTLSLFKSFKWESRSDFVSSNEINERLYNLHAAFVLRVLRNTNRFRPIATSNRGKNCSISNYLSIRASINARRSNRIEQIYRLIKNHERSSPMNFIKYNINWTKNRSRISRVRISAPCKDNWNLIM